MKKKEIKAKLASLGVKPEGAATVPELRKMLTEAQADPSKPGHNIHKGPQPGDRI
jgi:hypothetical protein